MADTATPKKGRKSGGAKKKASKATHPSTIAMIMKAMEAEKDPKGVSVIAIKKYILAKYPTVKPVMLRHMLRRALEAALKDGKLVRPHGQGSTTAMSGRYRVATKAKKAAAKPAKAKKPKAAKKAKSPAKKKTPKKKAAAKPKKAKSPKKTGGKKTPKKPKAKKAAKPKKSPKKAGRPKKK